MIFHPDTEWPARRCSGDSCKQGRVECATPDACHVAEPVDKMLTGYARAVVSIVLVALAFAVVLLISWVSA